MATAQRIELNVAAHVTLDAVLLLPERWGDDPPGVLVRVDEGGKAEALDGPAAAAARERGWAVLAPDLRGTGESAASEFELATAAWLLDRDLLADRVGDLRAAVGWLSERYSTGQQLDKGRIAVHGAGAFGLVALAGRRARPPHRRREQRAVRHHPGGAARDLAAHHADGVPVRRPGDVGPARPGAPRRTAAAAPRRRGADEAALVAGLLTSWRADGGHRPRGRRARLELRAARRPAAHPPGRDRGRRERAGGRHGPPGLARGGAARPARPARPRGRLLYAPGRRPRRRHRRDPRAVPRCGADGRHRRRRPDGRSRARHRRALRGLRRRRHPLQRQRRRARAGPRSARRSARSRR